MLKGKKTSYIPLLAPIALDYCQQFIILISKVILCTWALKFVNVK